MNRDESVLRQKEIPPKAYEHGWYPLDPQSGGTWCGMSKFGTVYCLLNRYDGAKTSPSLSRGTIIPDLLAGKNITDFSVFDSFSLITYGKKEKHLTVWDGKKITKEYITALPFFMTSSSYKKDEVIAYRKKTFRNFIKQHPSPGDVDILFFHLSVNEERKDYAIFTERKESHTTSTLQLSVGKTLHSYYYDRNGNAENNIIS